MKQQLKSKFSSWVEIDLDQIQKNILEIKEKIPEGCKITAVLKANAYGHGAVKVAREAISCGIDTLAISIPEEGIELRNSGIKNAAIYLLSPITPEQIDYVFDFNLVPSISNIEQANLLSQEAAKRGLTININIKVDTGLGRFGIYYDDIAPFLKSLIKLTNLKIEGIYTHFATAEEGDNEFLREQLSRFEKVLAVLEATGINVPLRHTAGSAAIASLPESYFDMVRPGLLLLGIYPSKQLKRDMNLKPALSFKTMVSLVKKVKKGSSVGYGRTYIAKKDTYIALCPLGFADGYPRSLSNRAEVLINGHRFPIIGKICLNNIMVEIGNNNNIHEGDEVILIGKSGHEEITIEELAYKAGTIVDEICLINPRVPRNYLSSRSLQRLRQY